MDKCFNEKQEYDEERLEERGTEEKFLTRQNPTLERIFYAAKMTSVVYFGVIQTRVLSPIFSEVATTFSEHHTFWCSVVGTKTFCSPQS